MLFENHKQPKDRPINFLMSCPHYFAAKITKQMAPETCWGGEDERMDETYLSVFSLRSQKALEKQYLFLGSVRFQLFFLSRAFGQKTVRHSCYMI